MEREVGDKPMLSAALEAGELRGREQGASGRRRRPAASAFRARQNATQPHTEQKWNSIASPRT